jgi:hypothetical protein
MNRRFSHRQSPAVFLVTKTGRASLHTARPWTPRPAKPPKTPVPARTVLGDQSNPPHPQGAA